MTNETPELRDPFGRKISYLRLSVTDRCDFRCVYCMSEHTTFLPKPDILTLEELDRLCTAFIQRGVTKLRVTGGEPLVRRGIMTFFQGMTRHLESGALNELTLTTNGTQLHRFADDLAAAGVKRINVSLDTLNDEKFAKITRWGRLSQVLEGLKAAQKAGLRIKINTVALKGFNEEELDHLVSWCADEGFDLTFIEVMPMGDMGEIDCIGQFWSLEDLRERLAEALLTAQIPFQHCPQCSREGISLRHWRRAWAFDCQVCGTRLVQTLGKPRDEQVSEKLMNRARRGAGMLERAARSRCPKKLRRAMRAVTFAMSLKTFRGDPSFALQNPRPEVRLFCLAAIAAARSHPLAKAAIVTHSIDDYARVALLRAFEKEPRLLAAVDHIAQRRATSAGSMTAASRN